MTTRLRVISIRRYGENLDTINPARWPMLRPSSQESLGQTWRPCAGLNAKSFGCMNPRDHSAVRRYRPKRAKSPPAVQPVKAGRVRFQHGPGVTRDAGGTPRRHHPGLPRIHLRGPSGLGAAGRHCAVRYPHPLGTLPFGPGTPRGRSGAAPGTRGLRPTARSGPCPPRRQRGRKLFSAPTGPLLLQPGRLCPDLRCGRARRADRDRQAWFLRLPQRGGRPAVHWDQRRVPGHGRAGSGAEASRARLDCSWG